MARGKSRREQLVKVFVRSLPVHLFVVVLRDHFLLLVPWIVLFLAIYRVILVRVGAGYLFLEPEYMGHTGFLSFFLVGLAYGWLIMVWNMCLFLLIGERYSFLAVTRRPLANFIVNNGLFILLFVSLYCGAVVDFGLKEGWSVESISLRVVGLLSGVGATAVLVYIVFFRELPSHEESHLYYLFALFGGRQTHIPAVASAVGQPLYYIIFPSLRVRRLRRVSRVQAFLFGARIIERHGSILLVFLGTIVFMVVLASMWQTPLLQIPAAASIFLYFSVVTMVLGMVWYWAGRWRAWAFAGLIALLALIPRNILPEAGFEELYCSPEVSITSSALDSMVSHEQMFRSLHNFFSIAERWKKKQMVLPGVGEHERVPLVVLCFSGGGLRAALWGFAVWRMLDSLSGGMFSERVFLVTGASGGMVGATYYRELLYRRKIGESVILLSPAHLRNVSDDLLNPVIFTLVTHDWFLPLLGIDRGRAWEEQLVSNYHGILKERLLTDYRQAEQSATIPLMVFTPVMARDGRWLFIGSQSFAFLTKWGVGTTFEVLDFHAIFRQCSSSRLRVVEALRASATFPYVMPAVRLPTHPSTYLVDAGLKDNFGIEVALRILYHLRSWIRGNVSKVVIVTVRDLPTDPTLIGGLYQSKSALGSFLEPVAGVYLSGLATQIYRQWAMVQYAREWFGVPVEVVPILYGTIGKKRASLSWHLTERQKQEILSHLQSPTNRQAVQRLRELLSF